MTGSKTKTQGAHLDESPAPWVAMPLAQALAAYPPGEEGDEADVGWQAVDWRPEGAPGNGIPRGTAVGGLARRLMALERARLRRRAPLMAPQGRRNGGRAGRGS